MRRTLFYLSSIVTVFSLIIICNVATTFGQKRAYRVDKEYRLLTQKLTSVDKIELFKLKLDYGQWTKEFENSKTIKGVEAKNIAALWRTQTYRPGLSACHNPIYGIKFYSGEKLIVFATVCWDCNTVGFEKPYINDTQMFDGSNKQGQQLLKFFQDAFPLEK